MKLSIRERSIIADALEYALTSSGLSYSLGDEIKALYKKIAKVKEEN
jgi:hypothetical protein